MKPVAGENGGDVQREVRVQRGHGGTGREVSNNQGVCCVPLCSLLYARGVLCLLFAVYLTVCLTMCCSSHRCCVSQCVLRAILPIWWLMYTLQREEAALEARLQEEWAVECAAREDEKERKRPGSIQLPVCDGHCSW